MIKNVQNLLKKEMIVCEKYMKRCLQLAALGSGHTAPNPLVGAVIVHGDTVIGEGFHRRYGSAHAEVNAIDSVADEKALADSTLYVNLEPCSHYGKTPPCAELIIRKGIPRVVVGHIDPFAEVSGRGIEMLRNNGIEVVCGVLEQECRHLNRRFLTFVEKRRPYIILKWAQSADGFIDRFRTEGDGQKPVRISTDFTKTIVHKQRAEEAAIMIGRRTLALDRPKLDVRYWDGQNPRIFIADSRRSLDEQLSEMYEQKIQSLIVEGGTQLLNSFIGQGLWDEANVEISEKVIGIGVAAPVLRGKPVKVDKWEHTAVFHFENRKEE